MEAGTGTEEIQSLSFVDYLKQQQRHPPPPVRHSTRLQKNIEDVHEKLNNQIEATLDKMETMQTELGEELDVVGRKVKRNTEIIPITYFETRQRSWALTTTLAILMHAGFQGLISSFEIAEDNNTPLNVVNLLVAGVDVYFALALNSVTCLPRVMPVVKWPCCRCSGNLQKGHAKALNWMTSHFVGCFVSSLWFLLSDIVVNVNLHEDSSASAADEETLEIANLAVSLGVFVLSILFAFQLASLARDSQRIDAMLKNAIAASVEAIHNLTSGSVTRIDRTPLLHENVKILIGPK